MGRTMAKLDDWLNGAVLVGDGGMGSLLAARKPLLRFAEEANLVAAEDVLAAHLEFIRAGADVIQTNTYGANAVKLGAHRYEDEVDRINEAGAKIAREAREVAGRDVLIAGSIGPLGTSVEHIGAATANGAATMPARRRCWRAAESTCCCSRRSPRWRSSTPPSMR